MSGSMRTAPLALATLAGVAVLVGAVGFGALLAGGFGDGHGPGMMGGYRDHMRADYGPGMMGGRWAMGGPGMMGGRWTSADPGPGDAGMVRGTAASPRVIRIQAGPGDVFSPSVISVARGETVTFVVTTMGPVEHEFMVGPADAVAADLEGTPEVESIAMMETRSLTYTFDGSGPYAYACHAEDHYENGMSGTITVEG